MPKRMSAEARVHYLERREIDKRRTMQRRADRRAAAYLKGVSL